MVKGPILALIRVLLQNLLEYTRTCARDVFIARFFEMFIEFVRQVA